MHPKETVPLSLNGQLRSFLHLRKENNRQSQEFLKICHSSGELSHIGDLAAVFSSLDDCVMVWLCSCGGWKPMMKDVPAMAIPSSISDIVYLGLYHPVCPSSSFRMVGLDIEGDIWLLFSAVWMIVSWYSLCDCSDSRLMIRRSNHGHFNFILK